MSGIKLWQGDLGEDIEYDECVDCCGEAHCHCKKCHAPMCKICYRNFGGVCSDCEVIVMEGKLAFDDASGGRGTSR